MKSLPIGLLLLLTILLISCDEETIYTPIVVTPEAEQIQMKVMHLEQDLFVVDFKNSNRVSQDLYQKYGAFWCHFVEADLALAACQSDSVQTLLYPFVVNSTILEAHQAIMQGFSPDDFIGYEQQLNQAFQKWKSIYPAKNSPTLVYYQSAWNSNITPMDEYLGISLDCYLGPEHKVTQRLSTEFIPVYKKKDMRKDYLVSDAIKGWVAYQHKELYQPKDLLHEFIFYGKLMYLSRSLLPEVPDSTMLNWSADELQWAKDNEWNTWKVVAKEDRLFDKKMQEINKWFAQGPFTGAQDIPQESSPQLGIWLGWQMVSQYMQAHPEVTLLQLMAESDNTKILSAYKPKRG
jgi:hypothetical protein